MPANPRAAVVTAVTAGLLLAACGGSGDGNGGDQPTPATTGPPPPLQTRQAASDGGTVEVAETGFRDLDDRVLWGATFHNTSQTDLLAYVDFSLTFRSADGQEKVYSSTDYPTEQRAYDVLPGETVVIGATETTVGFAPDSLDVAVDTNEWYPMADLEANGVPVGVDVTGSLIDVGTAGVHVQAQYTSSYEEQPGHSDELSLLVVVRDAAGDLIGALAPEPADAGASPPGPHEQDASIPLSRWPDGADPDTSEVIVVKACCAWVGVT